MRSIDEQHCRALVIGNRVLKKTVLESSVNDNRRLIIINEIAVSNDVVIRASADGDGGCVRIEVVANKLAIGGAHSLQLHGSRKEYNVVETSWVISTDEHAGRVIYQDTRLSVRAVRLNRIVLDHHITRCPARDDACLVTLNGVALSHVYAPDDSVRGLVLNDDARKQRASTSNRTSHNNIGSCALASNSDTRSCAVVNPHDGGARADDIIAGATLNADAVPTISLGREWTTTHYTIDDLIAARVLALQQHAVLAVGAGHKIPDDIIPRAAVQDDPVLIAAKGIL